ncbi:putative membrane protein (TIGR04086 family) [Fontibacillus solani]|uniref:Putative membrane protein, TIGR04086 family n=2 Tax=Fontibacillus TaxID=995014 RepID=A0A1G7Q5W9_9BACL|nr:MULTISPECIES: TIGR04086 family membrane protein [Fontibacillus]MBA9088269.1 putative membrane protein (TIGR04086 family) [Fontibacillus solani]SDF93884.1 putative membrane protein, TIGR04086 family [Fontibacillus panacisegetis]
MHYIRLIFSFRLSHPTLSGLWYAFLWMMIGALGLSLLLQSEIIEETDLTLYIYIVHSLSALFGGLVSGKRAGRKGLYQGAVTGLFYGVLLFIISFLALDSSLTFSDLSLLIPALLIGAAGGVLGVNLHKK